MNSTTKHTLEREYQQNPRNTDKFDLVNGIETTLFRARELGKPIQQLEYHSRGFLELSKAVELILENWSPLKDWFCVRLESTLESADPLPIPHAAINPSSTSCCR